MPQTEQPQTEETFEVDVKQEAAEEKDAVQSSILQAPITDNPFIRAEESEEYKRLEREYKEYRTKKVLSKIDGIIGGGSYRDVKEAFKSVGADGRAKAVVLPRFVKLAKKELPVNVRVESLINYPLCSGTKKGVLCEIKAAFQAKADMAVGVNTCQLASGNPKPVEKDLKLLYKKGKNKKVKITPLFNCEALSVEQKNKLARLVKQYKFSGVKIAVPVGECSFGDAADTVKIFSDTLTEQCPVEAVGYVSSPDVAESLFTAGADRIITFNYNALKRKRLDDILV